MVFLYFFKMNVDLSQTLPNEILELIFNEAIADKHIELLSAIELTCRRFYDIAKQFRRAQWRDLVEYYLTHNSATGVEFALSLDYQFIHHHHVKLLIKSPIETVEAVFKIVTNIRMEEFVEECLRKERQGHMRLALKYGYAPDNYIITVAVDYARSEMLLVLLQHMQHIGDRLRAIEAAIMHSFTHMSLFKMLNLGLSLKHIPVDPRYVSMVIYSIYKHSSSTQEPEFIIRWLLDNLEYRPIFIPIRESFTRVNNMLKEHKFKFIRCDVQNVEHLFRLW
jgi:hypothetical protein